MILSKYSKHANAALGEQGEDAVVDHLHAQGYTILERNYRQRMGEIDIIAGKDDVIAFVEVKLRTRDYFNLSEVVTYGKQQKVIRTAQYYALVKKLRERVLRFDVALVIQRDYTTFDVTYIPNAYS